MDDKLTQTLRQVIREEVRPIVKEEVHAVVKDELASLIKIELKPINNGLNSIDDRMGSLETKVDLLESRMGSLETKVDLLESRMGSLEGRMDAFESQMIELRVDMNDGFRKIDIRLKKQDDKLDAILEAWSIQKVHRRELDDHNTRITELEHRIPTTI